MYVVLHAAMRGRLNDGVLHLFVELFYIPAWHFKLWHITVIYRCDVSKTQDLSI